MLHPSQFKVNEAWIAFRLNDEPIQTKQDGSFHCICLMDAASCFILGNDMISAHEAEPSQLESLRLLEAARAHKKELPNTLFLPSGQFQTHLAEQAKGKGIEVVSVEEDELLVFIGEARQGFKEQVQGGSSSNRRRGRK